MDKSDFTFMKTGFGNFQDSESMEKNIIGTLVLFTENAMKSAGFYTKHCKRKNITKEDIKRCLMFEVFLFCYRGLFYFYNILWKKLTELELA